MGFEARRFENLAREVGVDEASFRYEMDHTSASLQNYIIVFTARSGSTWLTKLLSSTDCLGHPEEYINPDFVPDVVKSLNCREPEPFLEILKRRRQTPNGIFGMEAREADISLFGEALFFRVFGPETLFFNLWRKNILAQAISLYRAIATKRYHSNEQDQNLPPPEYDADEVQYWLEHIAAQENENLAMLRRA